MRFRETSWVAIGDTYPQKVGQCITAISKSVGYALGLLHAFNCISRAADLRIVPPAGHSDRRIIPVIGFGWFMPKERPANETIPDEAIILTFISLDIVWNPAGATVSKGR
jgi:hypothetical protein